MPSRAEFYRQMAPACGQLAGMDSLSHYRQPSLQISVP